MSEQKSSSNGEKRFWMVLIGISVAVSAGMLVYGFVGQKPQQQPATTVSDPSMMFSPAELEPAQPGMEIDAEVPALTVKDIDGKEVKLPDGKPRALFFANLTCPCVKAYNSRMKAFHDKYAAQGVEVAYVFPDPNDTVSNIRELVTRENYPWQNLVDTDQELMRLFNVEATTEVVLIDAKGKLRYHGRVDDNIYEPEQVKSRDLDNAMVAMLDGKEVPVKEARALSCRIPKIR